MVWINFPRRNAGRHRVLLYLSLAQPARRLLHRFVPSKYSEASAFSVIHGKGYSSKRTAFVEYIYPRGHVPDIAFSEEVAEDSRSDVIEHNVTINRHVHVTVYQVERHYRPHIRVHRAASFHPSRIRVHRAGTFAY